MSWAKLKNWFANYDLVVLLGTVFFGWLILLILLVVLIVILV